MTEIKRRQIDPQQRMPENVVAALPPDNSPVFHPLAPTAASIKREGPKRPQPPERAIRIAKTPPDAQVPVQGSSKVNSSIAHAKRDSFNGQPGGAEAQVAKRRAEATKSAQEAKASTSVIK